MMIVGMDTSTASTSVALWEDGTLLAEIVANQPNSHSEQLVGLIRQILEISGKSLEEVDYYACTKGPGSFTGLRIGAAAAKGFAQYHNKPIVGVSLLELTAWNAAGFQGWICPVVDAQRDQVYAGVYTWDGNTMTSVSPDGVFPVAEFTKRVEKEGVNAVFLGSGTKKLPPEYLHKENIQVMGNLFQIPRASMLCQAASEKVDGGEPLFTWMDFEPEYFRKSQAEIQMEQRKGKGL